MHSSRTSHEILRRSIEVFLPPLYRKVRKALVAETSACTRPGNILDVGGRKSPYTIGVRGHITIIDLPRESDIQNALNLGITDPIVAHLKKRRSNVENVIAGDMTCSGLPDDAFDVVVSVEVLEHVEADERFVSEIARVLKPGGKFIMTTPNGDFVQNHNPDHKRHYKKTELLDLLDRHFTEVKVQYGIAGGRFRRAGLKSWSVTRPVQTVSSAFGNIVNTFQSSRPGIEERSVGTHHLFAVARKGDCTTVLNK